MVQTIAFFQGCGLCQLHCNPFCVAHLQLTNQSPKMLLLLKYFFSFYLFYFLICKFACKLQVQIYKQLSKCKLFLKYFMGTNKKRSDCPLSNSLDIFGDKWSLLIIRDLMFFKKCTY